jgi:hypothetical protein
MTFSSHRRRRLALISGTSLTILGVSSVPASAQWGGNIVQADSLLALGRVSAAESLYYAASSARPRDATARAALGRYLAARGALRIGAVLLEEARQFGGDTARIARSLAPIYGSLGDYRALATLPRSPLTTAEQSRTRWLVVHPPVLEFPDSVARIPYKPLNDGKGLGVISLTIGERRVDAVIDPQASGVVVRGAFARKRRGLRAFGDDSSGAVAVVPELHIGDVTLSNVPARINAESGKQDRGRSDVLIGLDVLRRLAPTFDPLTDTLTLRRTGQVPPNVVGTRMPMMLDDEGLRVVLDGRWEAAESRRAAQLLGTRRWTLDAKRGVVLLE